MNKVLRRRFSFLTLVILIVALSLVISGALALSRPLPEYLVAKEALIPGQRVTMENFELQGLNLGAAEGKYLSYGSAPETFYLSELTLKGELIPERNVRDKSTKGMTSVVLKPSLPVSQKVIEGSWVQIWRTAPSAQGFIGELLVARSQVLAVTEDQSFISEEGSRVEVLVSQQQAALLLQTLASEFDVYLLVSP
jgi:hypothetical protein